MDTFHRLHNAEKQMEFRCRSTITTRSIMNSSYPTGLNLILERWQQDIFTVPLKLALLPLLVNLIPTEQLHYGLLTMETADKEAKKQLILVPHYCPRLMGTSAVVLSGLSLFTKNFPLYRLWNRLDSCASANRTCNLHKSDFSKKDLLR